MGAARSSLTPTVVGVLTVAGPSLVRILPKLTDLLLTADKWPSLSLRVVWLLAAWSSFLMPLALQNHFLCLWNAMALRRTVSQLMTSPMCSRSSLTADQVLLQL